LVINNRRPLDADLPVECGKSVMRESTAFVISPFTNPSGEVVFRVSGWLDGQRVRKNFSTRKEAGTERQILDVQRRQTEDSSLRTAITRLTNEQIREAEFAYGRLAGQKRSLTFYLEFALTKYREPERELTLKAAIDDYVAAKEHEQKQDQLSISQLGHIRRELARFEKLHPHTAAAEITSVKVIAFLELGRPSLKTYNNRRGILSTFLKYCFYKGWIAENPLARIPAQRIRRRRGAARLEEMVTLIGSLRPRKGRVLSRRPVQGLRSGRRPLSARVEFPTERSRTPRSDRILEIALMTSRGVPRARAHKLRRPSVGELNEIAPLVRRDSGPISPSIRRRASDQASVLAAAAQSVNTIASHVAACATHQLVSRPAAMPLSSRALLSQCSDGTW
jgi:hypothetical protein